MPPNIDMSLIREAMARRAQQGGAPAGGTTIPAMQQQAGAAGVTPTGQPNVPGQLNPVALQTQNPQQNVTKNIPKQPPNFDDSTKVSAKALIQQLMRYV